MHILYFICSIGVLAFAIFANFRYATRENRTLICSFLRPSQIAIMYTGLFYLFGSIFFYYNNILSENLLIDSIFWSLPPLFLWVIATLFVIIISNITRFGGMVKEVYLESGYLDVILPIIGIASSFLYMATDFFPFLLFSISLFFMAFGNRRSPSLVLIVFSLISIYISMEAFAFSKRNVIFPAIIIISILLEKGGISKRSSFVIAGLALFSIIPMSIYRGYGSYDIYSFYGAFYYSLDYISGPNFWKYFANNMEFSSYYFHGINAVEIFWQSGNYLYGETLLRSVISPFIYVGLIEGLDSSIDIYTNLYDPNFRAIGGSYPVNVFSELFMNFGVFSIVIYPIICLIFDKIYFKILECNLGVIRFGLSGGFLFSSLLLFRGAGFSLFFYNIIFIMIPVMIFYLIFGRSHYADASEV